MRRGARALSTRLDARRAGNGPGSASGARGAPPAIRIRIQIQLGLDSSLNPICILQERRVAPRRVALTRNGVGISV